MKMAVTKLRLAVSILILISGITMAKAQGTVTFDAHNNWVGTNYVELQMAFQVVLPRGGSYDYMGIGYGAGNTPYNGTPWMGWIRQNNPYGYVSLSLTNGSLFGLTSVQLADPIYPSASPLSISWVGHLSNGSTVTNIFTTPGNTRAFLNFLFTSDFSSGLTSVDILAPRWAMDNLVWVPEPTTWALLAVGVGMLSYVWFRSSKKQHR